MERVYIIFLLGAVSYSSSSPSAISNPLDNININFNLGKGNNGEDYLVTGNEVTPLSDLKFKCAIDDDCSKPGKLCEEIPLGPIFIEKCLCVNNKCCGNIGDGTCGNQANPCPRGKPLTDASGSQLFCGRGPNRQDCPGGSSCLIHPADEYAVCCTDETDCKKCESVVQGQKCGQDSSGPFRMNCSECCSTSSSSSQCAQWRCDAGGWLCQGQCPKPSSDECNGKPCGASCNYTSDRDPGGIDGVCDGKGVCQHPIMNPCVQLGCKGKLCGEFCHIAGDLMGYCDMKGNCVGEGMPSCGKQGYCKHPHKNIDHLYKDGESFKYCCNTCHCDCNSNGDCVASCTEKACPCSSCKNEECDGYMDMCYWNNKKGCILKTKGGRYYNRYGGYGRYKG